MKAVDREDFEQSMAEELDNIYENKIYEIIKKSEVSEGHTIIR